MKTISYVLQKKGRSGWIDDLSFGKLTPETGLEMLIYVRKSNPEITWRLVKRITVTRDVPVKERKKARR